MAKETKKFTIADLNSAMNKNSQFGGLLSEGSVSKITEYIHTGNYMLNACVSGDMLKGIPNNRSICISGESGCLEKNECINVYIFKTSTDYDKHETHTK